MHGRHPVLYWCRGEMFEGGPCAGKTVLVRVSISSGFRKLSCEHREVRPRGTLARAEPFGRTPQNGAVNREEVFYV